MTEARLVVSRFGPGPYSLEGLAQLVRQLGDVEGDDLGPLVRKLGVDESAFQIKAVADLLGISDEPRELPELYSAIRRLLEVESRERPLHLVFENVDAAGPAFFNLVEYLQGTLRDGDVVIETKRTGTPPDVSTDPIELRDLGMHSLRRSDMPAAHALLSRAAELSIPGPLRCECLAASCDALLAGNMPDAALGTARTGLEEATALGDDRYRARFTFLVTMLEGSEGDLEATLEEIAAALRDAGDDAGAAQAVEAIGHSRWEAGDGTGAIDRMDAALALARSSGDRQTATRITAWLCDAAATEQNERALQRLNELGWAADYSPLVEVKRLVTIARLHKTRGDANNAQASLERARELQEDLGQPSWVAGIPESGRIEDL